MKHLIAIALLLVVTPLLAATQSLAADEVACIEILPCNEDGSVYAPYNEGDCADHFEEVCRNYHENQLIEKLDQCEVRSSNFQTELEFAYSYGDRMARKYRLAQRKLRQAQARQ